MLLSSIKKNALLSLLVALALCVSASCYPTRHYPPAKDAKHQVISRMQNPVDSTTALLGIKDNEVKLVGSGVIIRCDAGKPIRVLTAFHVIDAITKANSPILIGSKEKVSFSGAIVLRSDPAHDLALVESISPATKSCSFSTLAEELPLVGSTVWVVGNPLAIEGNISHGVLSKVYWGGKEKETLVYRVDAPAIFGNSGGPLFNDRGEVIGIMSYLQALPGDPFGFTYFPVPGGGHAVALPHCWALVYGL